MKFITIPVLALSLVLTACGSKLEGSYGSDKPGTNGVVLTLKSNGKAVYLGVAGITYEVDGKDVTLHSPQGVLVLKVQDDGSLDFPYLGNLKKVPS